MSTMSTTLIHDMLCQRCTCIDFKWILLGEDELIGGGQTFNKTDRGSYACIYGG